VLRSVCHDPAPRLRKTNPETPAWLEELVARLLSKDPADRPASADEVVAGMERRDATLGQARRPHRMRPWLAAAAALVLCVAGLGVSDATGVTQLMPTVIRLVTGEGTLVVQVDDPTVKVAINGDELTITGAGIHEVRLKPGSHRVDTQRDGKLLGSDIVTIARGGRELVRVSHETPTSDAPPAPAPSAPSTIDFAAREAELRESIRLHPNVPAYRYHLALNLSDQKRYDEAVGEYRAVLELPGVGRGVRLYLAGTLQKQGKFAEAEEEFREYLLADPNEVAVLSQLAINLATQKKLVELEEIYRTILELEPGKHATRSQLGQLLRQTDRLGESEAELRAVIDERPQDAGAYYQLALTLETAGKWAEAEAAYREHQRISPNDLIRARLASVLRRQGKDAEADADCAKVPPRRCP
jgi:cytochrome c-type biogenesis protein CcmH/NrfG